MTNKNYNDEEFCYNIESIYERFKGEAKKDIQKAGLPFPKNAEISKSLFVKIVRRYIKYAIHDAIYKYRRVKVGYGFGDFECNKVYCTEFNVKGLDKTDGYFHHLHHHRTSRMKEGSYRVRFHRKIKRLVYRNVVYNGADYHEHVIEDRN